MLTYFTIILKSVYCPSETPLDVRHILTMHPYGRKILCAQRVILVHIIS
jgi:hypothetical protein